MIRNAIVSVLASVVLVSASAAQQSSRDFDITAVDGTKIRATHYSPGKPGPGMLLLHQCNMNRASWRSLATAFAETGVHVLTIDYRGYGDTPRSGTGNTLESDIDAALQTLLAQTGVDANRIAAGGASCGVNNSIQVARRSNQIKALVLLSGPAQESGLAYLRSNTGIAVFGAASSEEAMAVNALQTVVGISRNPASTMRVLSNAGHGVPMFTADSTLLPAIVNWVSTTLR